MPGPNLPRTDLGKVWKARNKFKLVGFKMEINLQSLEDSQVGYISQKYIFGTMQWKMITSVQLKPLYY